MLDAGLKATVNSDDPSYSAAICWTTSWRSPRRWSSHSRTWSPWSATRSRARFSTRRPRTRIWAGSSAAPRRGGMTGRAGTHLRFNAASARDGPVPTARPGIRVQGGHGRPTATGASSRARPRRRIGTPDDIAEFTCFLLSDAAGFITGPDLCRCRRTRHATLTGAMGSKG